MLNRLAGQLGSRLPLLGWWIRRRAANLLRQHDSPYAIGILARALSIHTDAGIHKIARQAVEKQQKPANIDAICQVWAETRHPWLAEQIKAHAWIASGPPRARVLSALQTGQSERILEGDSAEAKALIEACTDTRPEISRPARACLPLLRRPSQIDALCAAWAEGRSPFLEAILLQVGDVARRPAEIRLLSALKNNQLEIVRRGGANLVAPLLAALLDADAQIASRAEQALGALEKPEAQDEACRLFIEGDQQAADRARHIILEAGYLPAEQRQRALFLFLTGQWQAYQALDFDQRLLRAAYQSASPPVRQAIRRVIQASGQIGLLNVLSGLPGRTRLTVLAPDETAFLVHMLIEQQAWPQLWENICELPFNAALQAVRSLRGAGWQPQAEIEQRLLAELGELIQQEMLTSAQSAEQALPGALLRSHVTLPTGRINALSFAPERPLIAVGASQRKVLIWDFQKGVRQALLSGFDHSIGEVAYPSPNQLVFAERTNKSSEICTTYLFDGRQTTRLYQQAGSITALEPVRGGQLLIAGRDQNITLFDLSGEQPRLIAKAQMPVWPRSLCASRDGKKAALLYRGAGIYSLPGLERQRWFERRYTTQCGTFSPDNKMLVIGQSDGSLHAISLEASETSPINLPRHIKAVQGLEMLLERSILVSAGAEGEVQFTGWANHKNPGKIRQPGKQLTSLHISPDGSFMALGDSDASLSLWDLRPLDIPDLFTIPFARSTPNHLVILNLLDEDTHPLPRALRNTLRFMERLLRHRFRYDIEVSEVASIKAGDYDIEIE